MKKCHHAISVIDNISLSVVSSKGNCSVRSLRYLVPLFKQVINDLLLSTRRKSRVNLLISVVKHERSFALECLILFLPVRKVNEVLVVLRQFFDNFLIPLQLSWRVLHRVEDEHSFGDVFVLMGSKPVWEDCIWRFRFSSGKLYYLNARRLKGIFEIVEFLLCLYMTNKMFKYFHTNK